MPKYSLIIDTAFESCQVGISQGDTCITMASVQGGGKHDIILAPLVEEIFKAHKIAVQDIEKIIVTTGPGRFTGLRVGIAFARGLALVHQTLMVGVLTTDALRWQVAQSYPDHANTAVLVAVKRGEIFVQHGDYPIERILDSELSDYFAGKGKILVAGMLSPETELILKSQPDIQWASEISEPSLEAIFAVSKSETPVQTAIIRPYYAA